MHGKLLIENSRHCSLQSAKEWWCGKGEYFETRGTFAIHKIQRMYFFKYCTMYMVYLSGLLLIIYCILHVSGVGREQLLTPAASNFLMLLRPQFVIHKVPVHNCSIFLSTGNMNDREYQCTIIFHRTANLIISIKKNITSRVSVRIWEKSEVRIRGEISKGISKQISKEGGRTLQNQLGSDVLFKKSPRQCLLFINLKYQNQNIAAAKYAESQNKTSNRQTHLALLIYQR